MCKQYIHLSRIPRLSVILARVYAYAQARPAQVVKQAGFIVLELIEYKRVLSVQLFQHLTKRL